MGFWIVSQNGKELIPIGPGGFYLVHGYDKGAKKLYACSYNAHLEVVVAEYETEERASKVFNSIIQEAIAPIDMFMPVRNVIYLPKE